MVITLRRGDCTPREGRASEQNCTPRCAIPKDMQACLSFTIRQRRATNRHEKRPRAEVRGLVMRRSTLRTERSPSSTERLAYRKSERRASGCRPGAMSVRRRQTALSPFASRDCLAQQLRKLCDVGCNPPRLVARYQSRRRSPAGLLLEIDIGERLTGLILHNETASLSSTTHGGGKRRWVTCSNLLRPRA
jgi:hypothetical protein